MLQTPHLVIRPLEDRVADAWLAMFADLEVTRLLPAGPALARQDFQRTIEARREMQREIGYAMWAVDDKASRSFIGQCGIRPAKPMDESASSEIELAYHFVRRAWNKDTALKRPLRCSGKVLDRSDLRESWRLLFRTTSARGGSWRNPECGIKERRTFSGCRA
jgi:hypothetical protein